MRKDTDVARRAAAQHGIVRREQVLASGLTRSDLHRRTAAGLLVPCHPGVLRAAGAPVTWRGDLLAAVWSAGDDAVASHRSAAALWQLDGFDHDVIELTIPPGFPPKRRGVIVHRGVSVDPADRTEIDAVPVTRIDATIIAVVAVLPTRVIPDVVDSALVQGLTRADRVLDKLLRFGRRGRRNAGALAAVLEARLDGARPHANRFERRLSRILVRAGLAEPVAQFEVRERGRVIARPDLAYPDVKIAIEADSYRWHGGRSMWGARSRPTHEARGHRLAGAPLLVA